MKPVALAKNKHHQVPRGVAIDDLRFRGERSTALIRRPGLRRGRPSAEFIFEDAPEVIRRVRDVHVDHAVVQYQT
jgi:hypothetical protein